MYFQGYMLPSGICVPSPCPKTSPIWGIRSASAGIMLSTVNRAVKPRAPTESLRNVSIGFTAKRSLCTKYAVEAMLITAIQITSKLKTQDLSPSMMVLNEWRRLADALEVTVTNDRLHDQEPEAPEEAEVSHPVVVLPVVLPRSPQVPKSG